MRNNTNRVPASNFFDMIEALIKDALSINDAARPEDLRSKLAEREIEITLYKNRIERLEQLARDLDAKLTEAEAKDLTP